MALSEGFEIINDDTVTPTDNSYAVCKDSGTLPRFYKFSKIWEWIWTKVKGATKSAADTSDPTAPINTTALNGALTNWGKSVLPSGTNLNDVTSEGEYTIVWANHPTNEPSGWASVDNEKLLITKRTLNGNSNSDYSFQEITVRGGNSKFIRTQYDKQNNLWTEWGEVALKSDLIENNYIKEIVYIHVTALDSVGIAQWASYPTGFSKYNTNLLGVQIQYSGTWYLKDTGIQIISNDDGIGVIVTNEAFCGKTVKLILAKNG